MNNEAVFNHHEIIIIITNTMTTKILKNISESFLTFWFYIYVAPEYQKQKYFACLRYSVGASIDSLSRNMARKISRIYQVQDLFDLLVMNSRIHRHKLQTWTIEKCSCKYERNSWSENSERFLFTLTIHFVP